MKIGKTETFNKKRFEIWNNNVTNWEKKKKKKIGFLKEKLENDQIVYDNHCSSTTGVAVGLSYEGVPATQSVSIAKLSPPIFMRKKPISPQYEPHELRPIQYSY